MRGALLFLETWLLKIGDSSFIDYNIDIILFFFYVANAHEQAYFADCEAIKFHAD